MIDPKEVKLFVATPVFNNCTYNYVQGCFDLGYGCCHYGIQVIYRQTVNNAYIQLARNKLANEFLGTDFTHFMFIDQDVGFRAEHVFQLLKADQDVVAGTYPIKGFNWKKIHQAVLDGVPADELEYRAAEHVFKLFDDNQEIPPNKLIEVKHIGTGFMMIKRHVFEQLAETVDRYVEDTPLQHEMLDFFGHSKIDNHICGEDVSFCKRVQAAGMKIHMAPWVQCNHYGPWNFNRYIVQEL